MKDEDVMKDAAGGGFAGGLMTVVIVGLAWAVLTAIAMEKFVLSLVPLWIMIVLTVGGLIALNEFPTKRWRVIGAVLFIVACIDLYLVNEWWDVILVMWMGMEPGGTFSPLMVNCILIGFVGAGSMLFLQLRPEEKPRRAPEKAAHQAG
ncbi:hypothetical protein KKG05_01640 [bacterium]|nr:hypothetical protein [bacterium]